MSAATSTPTALNYAAAARSASATAPQTPATPATPTSPAAPDQQPKDSVLTSLVQRAAPMAVPTTTETTTPDVKVVQPEYEMALNAPSVSEASCTTHNEAPTSTTESRKDDETGSEISARRSERGTGHQTQPQARTAESGADSRRNRRGQPPKDSANNGGERTAEKESASPTPKVELSEAPIPLINPWSRGNAAHLLKSNGSQSVKPTPLPATERISPAVPDTSAQSARVTQSINGESHVSNPNARAVLVSGKVAAGDGNRGRKNGLPQDKSGPRMDTAAKPSLRPTDDGSWPTPETANNAKEKEEKCKPLKGSERPATDEGDEAPVPKAKQSQKKWTKMEGFEPTVKFETQLPNHLKPGTRSRQGGRGGREGGPSRNGGSGGKSSEKGASSSVPASKGVNGENRDGPRDSGTNRGNAGPSSSKRGAVEGSNARDQRKAHTPANARVRDAAVVDNNQSQNHGSGQTQTQGSHGRDRTDGRERNRGNGRNRNGYNGSTPQINTQPGGSFSAGANAGAGAGAGFTAQTPSTPRGQTAPFTSPTARGGPFPHFSQGRGGRGAVPPRGPPRTGYTTLGNANGRQMQSGMPFSPQPMHHMAGMPSGSYQNGPSPYPPPPIEPLRWVTLVSQIQWYFSQDNLVKDVFLRKHMDGQGFVPVSLIAGFNRVQQLVADVPEQARMDVILRACLVSNVELCYCDDGVHRLRTTVTTPEEWIFKPEERYPQAQNDGPASVVTQYPPPDMLQHQQHQQHQPHQQQGQQYPTHAGPFVTAPTMTYAGAGESLHGLYLNGAGAGSTAYGNGYGHGMQGSQGIADLPNGNGFGRNGTTNGGSAFKADVPEFNPAGAFQQNGHGAFNGYQQRQGQTHGQGMVAHGGFQTQAGHGVATPSQNGLASPHMDQDAEANPSQKPETSARDKETAKPVVADPETQVRAQNSVEPSKEGLGGTAAGVSQANDIVPS